MSDIAVSVSQNPKRESVLINPYGRAGDTFDQNTGKTVEGNNVLAVGATSRDALAKHYGKRV